MVDGESHRAEGPGPQVYLAVERTFLAWIRTGLALMSFGFVVARFGLFLRELRSTNGAHAPEPHGVSSHFGIALVVIGVLLTFVAVGRYVNLLRRLGRGEVLTQPSRLAVALGLTLAVAGAAVSVYLIMTAM